MSFSDFYLLNEKQIANLYKDLAVNFYDDDLYRTVFPDEGSRPRILRYIFKHYLRALRPHCHFLADSKDMNSVMVIWDSSLERPLRYRLAIIWLNIKMIPMLLSLHSLRSVRHVIDCWDMFTSRWIDEFVQDDYFHLDLFFTRQDQRGKGLGHSMMEQLLEEAEACGYDITMETHHADNLSFYQRAGFVLMSEITHSQYQIHQYNLLHKTGKG